MSKQTGCDCHYEFKALRDQLAAAEARAVELETELAEWRKWADTEVNARLRASPGSAEPVACIPDPVCRCCVCQGIHCLIPHPGHSHDDGEAASPIDRWLKAHSRQRDSDPLKRLHNLVDSLQRCDRCQSEMTTDDEPVVLCATCAAPRQPDVTAALLAALKEAEQAIHSEYCTAICHPACCAVTAAIKLAEATPDTPGGRG